MILITKSRAIFVFTRKHNQVIENRNRQMRIIVNIMQTTGKVYYYLTVHVRTSTPIFDPHYRTVIV